MAIDTVPAGAAGDFEQVNVSTAAIGISAAKYAVGSVRAGTVWVDADTFLIKFTIDGTTPTATLGGNIPVNTRLVLTNPSDIANLRMIQTSAGAAVANVTFFRERSGVA